MPPLSERTARSLLLPALVYTALTSAIVSSLGMLLVPTIAEELSVSVSSAQWMLTINLLVGAVATPIMGRLSDGPHKKRLLLVSLATILVAPSWRRAPRTSPSSSSDERCRDCPTASCP